MDLAAVESEPRCRDFLGPVSKDAEGAIALGELERLLRGWPTEEFERLAAEEARKQAEQHRLAGAATARVLGVSE